MNEETDGLEAASEATAASAEEASAQVETTSEATAEQPTETETSELADDAGEATGVPEKRVPWFQKRIDEVTRQKYEAAREADYWRGVAEGRNPAATQAPAEGPPREDQFEDYQDFEQARIEYAVEQRLQTAREIEQRTAVHRSYEERAAKLRETADDYDTVVNDPTLKITTVMAEVIRESDVGPQVAYHLGTNRAEAERIASLPPHRQAAELGKLEVRLTQPAKTPSNKPNPPAPGQTVSGISAGLTKSAEEMTFTEYRKAREEGRIT